MSGTNSDETFALVAPELGVTVLLSTPAEVRFILERALAGWERGPALQEGAQAHIRVVHDQRYSLTSAYYTPERAYSDPVALLNELLIALAYVVKSQRPDLLLLHGAAFERDGEDTVVFAQKKAGKSVLVAQAAARQMGIYGDDMLLWSPKALQFIGLGMSVRLRRPVPEAIVQALGREAFITGQHTCYLAAEAIRLSPAGRGFAPDRVMTLTAERELKPVRFYNVRKRIEQHRIS